MSDDSARLGPLSMTPATEGRTGGEESLAGIRDPTETTGSTVPHYRILGLIGTGGMGVVYRAEDTLLGRTVALKFLPPMLTPNPRAKARFLNEARAASALDHPNICTIYEVGETAEGQLYLAMAFYEGETLKQRLERGPLPVAEALHIALQVARGLAKAHRKGIVHRDIKPANLMLDADGIVKILDFGIARLPDQSPSGSLLGTPGYMSPEQVRVGEVDARSDVWSLGIVLREMLTGWHPDHGGLTEPPPGEKASSREEMPGPFLPQEAPPGIDGLLSRMLAENPSDRHQDASALLADLSALERAASGLDGTPARRRLPAWVPILVVATLAVAAAFWLLRSGRRPGEARLDPRRITVERLTDLPGKEWFPSLTPDGNFFVYARKVGDRSRLFLKQVGGGNAIDLLPDSHQGDSQPAVSPDGQQIAFRSEREGGGIFVMGLMGGESVRRVTEFGFNPAWSPDGKEILYATDGIDNPLIRRRHPSQIYRVNLTTGERRLVHQGDAVQPSWSPHGFRIAYWETSPSGQRVIWTIPAEGGEAVKVTAGTSVDWNPVWSPDGRYLYFASDRSGITNLWRVPIDESAGNVLGEPELVTASGQAGMLSLSRDGKRIVYARDETRAIIEKVGFDLTSGVTGPAVTIIHTAAMIPEFDVSPDGRWLVYQALAPKEDLFVIRPDGTGLRQLTNDVFRDRGPRWSLDGTRIAFYSNRSDKYEIWTIRADGGQLEQQTIIPGRPVYNPIWSPSGRWLACDLEENEALIDLTLPVAGRRPQLFPPADRGMGFTARSWSADGRWLAGVLQRPDGKSVPGVVLYSLADRIYVPITDRGESQIWLSDSRHLLYWDSGSLLLLDTRSRTSRHVLTTPPDSEYSAFRLSPDDRILYLSRNTEQGDIWLLTLQ